MREIVRIEAAEVLPAPEVIAQRLGLPAGAEPDGRTQAAIREALDLLRAGAKPVGLAAEIGTADFAAMEPAMSRCLGAGFRNRVI